MTSRTFWIWIGAALLLRATAAIIMPLIDPSEGRYAQIASDMVARNDYMTPMVWIDGELIPFMGKPPLYFWLASAGLNLFGHNEFAVRWPSLLAALLALIFLHAVLRRRLDPGIARDAAIITFSSVFFFAVAGSAMLDMVLTLCVSAAQFAYFAFVTATDRAARKRWSLAVFTALALGFLTKGPVAIALFGLPVFLWTAFTRSWRDLRNHAWVSGILLFLLIASPWFIHQELRTPGFLKYFFLNENLLRYTTQQYGDMYGRGHRQFFGISLLLMALAALPWIAWAGWLAWKRRGVRDGAPNPLGSAANYFLLITVATGAFFIFAKQLLWYYVAPAVPACATWCAIVFRRAGVPARRILATASVTVAAFFLFLIGSVPWQNEHRSSRTVLREARAIYVNAGLDGKIHFYRQTPYSSLFYGTDVVEPGPETTIEAVLEPELADLDRDIFIIKTKYASRVPEAMMKLLQRDREVGEWTLFLESNDGA